MPRSKLHAACWSCGRRGICDDARTLEQFHRFLENSGLAAELRLPSGNRYRLGCERYQSKRNLKPARRPTGQLPIRDD